MEATSVRNPIQVLWIEDDQLYRESVQYAISSATVEIEFLPGAGNARQGVRNAKVYSPDLVVADLRLPLDADDGSASPDYGIAMIKVISDRRTAGKPCILALSHVQDDHPDLVARAVRAGADSYIVKGQRGYRSGDQLAEIMLRLVIEGKPNWGPEIAQVVQEHQDKRELSYEERKVYDLARKGKSDKEIAAVLGKALGTVKVQMRSVLSKTGTKSRHQLKEIKSGDEFGLFGLDEV